MSKSMKKVLAALCGALFAFTAVVGTNVTTLAVQAEESESVELATDKIIETAGTTLDGANMGGGIIYVYANDVTVKNCTNVGGIVIGSEISFPENVVIKDNKINGNTTGDAIRVTNAKNATISGNEITNSSKYAMNIISDTNSVISGNTIKTSCSNGGDAVIITKSTGTKFKDNTITDTKQIAADWGNGLVVGESGEIEVSGNTVTSSSNHGISVSFASSNITVSGNTVSTAQNDGISISRGCENITVSENTIDNNKGMGVVFDGSDPSYPGGITGTISKNTISSSSEYGVYITGKESSNGTITVSDNEIKNSPIGISIAGSVKVAIENNTITDNKNFGVHLIDASVTTLTGNIISKTTRDDTPQTSGVVLGNTATTVMNNNVIANYGYAGIIANEGTTLTCTNNQVSVSGTAPFAFTNAYYTAYANDVNKVNNAVLKPEISTTKASAGNYKKGSDGMTGGAVVNGVKYPATVGEDGKFEVEYPEQSSTDGIVVYFKDGNGNSMCINASPSFRLDGLTEEQMEQIKEFVTRLYSVCLDRTPDAGGLDDWSKKLASGSISGVDAAYGFIFSPEFKKHNYCNSCYVDHLYNAFMGRNADAGGKKYWIDNLEGGMTREAVFNGFALSNEFAGICANYGIKQGDGIKEPEYGTVPTGSCSIDGTEDGVTAFVTRLYNVCLDRNPDKGGLEDWTNKLWNHTASGTEIAYGFIFSPEFQGRGFSDDEYVEYMYKAFFGRNSDAGGKADWLDRMANEGYTREDVFNGFTGSQEFDKLCKKYGITK